jgi:hypothetical protein
MSQVRNAKHWSDMAEEARRLADDMIDLQTKRIMMGFAADYESFAQFAQRIASTRRWPRLRSGMVSESGRPSTVPTC